MLPAVKSYHRVPKKRSAFHRIRGQPVASCPRVRRKALFALPLLRVAYFVGMARKPLPP